MWFWLLTNQAAYLHPKLSTKYHGQQDPKQVTFNKSKQATKQESKQVAKFVA